MQGVRGHGVVGLRESGVQSLVGCRGRVGCRAPGGTGVRAAEGMANAGLRWVHGVRGCKAQSGAGGALGAGLRRVQGAQGCR